MIAASLFVLAFATVPLVRMELYPFSRAPMFSDAPLYYCEYTVNDPDCNELDVLAFGLQRNYWGNPIGAGVGYLPPPSLDVFGEVAEPEDVLDHVRARLADFPDLPYVEVTQTVIGPVDERRIGILSWFRLHADNPHWRDTAR